MLRMPLPRVRGAGSALPWLAVLTACSLAALPGPVAAQPAPAPYRDSRQIPDTPAYARAREVAELVNAGDEARVRAWIDSACTPAFSGMAPMAEHLAVFHEVRAGSGGFDVHGARAYDPPRPATSAILIVRNRLTEAWEAIVVDVEEAAPHRVAGLRFAPARPPSDLPPEQPLEEAEVARRLGALVDRLAAADAFSGTVLLARNGRVLLERAAGVANRDFMAPVTIDTKFNLGSMNKMFTAVAIAQLAEQGKLGYDDPLGRHLGTEWLAQDILDRVTIRHLLTHTSGLGSYFNETFDRSSRALFREVDDYRPLVQGDTLQFAPGTRWSYSNTGFLLLGAVVEKASGENYFDYIRRHVTGPAGMTRTDCYDLDRVNENLAVGYEKETGPDGTTYANNIFQHVIRGGPAGGGYSTVRDLLAFGAALRGGALVRPDTRELMWTPSGVPGGMDYGFGFGIFTTPIGRAVGHSGGFAGINSELLVYPEAGWTIAVMSNYGMGAQPVVQGARRLIERR